jgi:hypothetical protein
VWAPTPDSHNELARRLGSAADATPLCLTQPGILELEAHLRDGSSPLPFGLLAGDVYLCPQTQSEYVLIDSVARARIELTEHDPYTQLAGELRSLISEQAKHEKIAIGWYLGGLGDDLTLDGDATDLHRKLFPEHWQVALVHGETSSTERGAFLRFESTWSLWYSIPFCELVSERGGRESRLKGTALRWANYHVDASARPADAAEGSSGAANVTSRSWWGALATSALAHHTVPSTPKPAGSPVTAPPHSAATPLSDASEAPQPDVRHALIGGRLVSVPFVRRPAKQAGKFGSSVGARNTALFLGALALVMLFVLYLIAR